MCDATAAVLAAVSAGVSLYGTSQASAAASASAQSVANENQRTRQAQNEGYTTRLAASKGLTDRQLAVGNQSWTDRTAAQERTYNAQIKALKDYQDVIDAQNTEAAGFRKTGDTAANTLLDATTGTTLADAQTARQNEAAALLEPTIPGPKASDPLSGTSSTSNDPVYGAASSRDLAKRATDIRDYGSKVSKVGSYAAPLDTVSEAVSANKIGIMPAAYAYDLLASGSKTRLLPSQTRYTSAGALGKEEQDVLKAKRDSAMDSAALTYGNTTAVANLKQADLETEAKNVGAQTRANLKADETQAGVIKGIGDLGLYATGYLYGDKIKSGISDIFGPSIPAGSAVGSNPTKYGTGGLY